MAIFSNDWKIDASIIVFTVFIFAYYKIRKIYRYFEIKNIKYVKPKFLLGSDPDGVLLKIPAVQSWDRIYKKLENEKYGGFYQALSPFLMIRDPECINQILTTSFEHFVDRNFLVDEKINPLDGHLFFLRGNKWKFLRNKLRPIFSSGNLKWMYEEIGRCGEVFVECVDKLADGRDLDIKELLSRYTTDVIASCAFGVESSSLKNPDSKFREVGREFFDPNNWNMVLMLLRFSIPRLLIFFKIRTITSDINNFFCTAMKNVMDFRRHYGIKRKDFVQLLLELKEKGTVRIDSNETDENEKYDESNAEKLEITDLLLTAQSFVFFMAGFETSSTTLYFTFYLLAKYQEAQNRARKEIQDIKTKYGHFTYDSLKEMTFLNNCISETLRMYPSVPVLNRECTKDYTLPDGATIEKGTSIIIPTFSIHHNPQYFPEPHKFNPDRFDTPPTRGTYLPFGDGPRICIGKRFAEVSMKIALARLLEKFKFEISPVNISEEVVTLNPRSIVVSPMHGLWIRIHKLNESK